MNKVRILVMDVDGTLTDGKIYMGESGELMKAFSIKDGFAIHDLLPQHNIIPVILTGRSSKIIENRARELGISHVIQGSTNKVEALQKLSEEIGCSLSEVAYIGDDLGDYDVMKLCGKKGCPNDAVASVRDICDFVSLYNGGDGAVREFAEWVILYNEDE